MACWPEKFGRAGSRVPVTGTNDRRPSDATLAGGSLPYRTFDRADVNDVISKHIFTHALHW